MNTEFKLRIATAAVLIPIVVWSIFFAPSVLAFQVFAAFIVVAGAWEWMALMGFKEALLKAIYAFLVLALLLYIQWLNQPKILWAACAISFGFWSLALRFVRNYPNWLVWNKTPVMAVIGFILLVPAWSSLVFLHQQSPFWLMYVFALVWGADTGAYFTGRAFGKRKLAPLVSPGKTLEGLLGGVVLTMILAFGVAQYQHLAGTKFWAFLGLSLLTVLASVLGDLWESMVKRQAGVKDSGTIFPGHGGALDRIDSLTAAAPVFVLGWLLAHGF